MNNLQKTLAKFRDERDWQEFHTPRNLILAMTKEMGELAEIFQWAPDDEIIDHDIERAAEEIADVIIYAVNFCNSMGLDADEIIKKKIAMNAVKYPTQELTK